MVVAAVSFAPADWIVFALFVGGMLALGFSATLRENTVLQYLAAGRNLSLPAFVATLVSTWYGGILGVGEMVSWFGAGTWVLIGLPYYVFALIYAFRFAGRVREAEQISIPERFEARFGRGPALAAGGLTFLLAVPAAHVLMLGVLVEFATGLPLTAGVIISVLVGSALLVRGGLMADVRLSIPAFLGMYVGFGAMLAFCVTNWSPVHTIASWQPPVTLAPPAGWVTIAGFFVLGAWTLVDPGFHQRVAGTASPEIGRRGVLWSVAFWMLFDVLSISVALYAVALSTEAARPLMLYPTFADQVLPAGLKGLFFCGMIGTILSALVGYSLVCGASLGRDVVGRALGVLDDARLNLYSQLGIGAGAVVAAALALSVKSVVDLWYQWGGCIVGALLLPVSISYLYRGALARPAVITVSVVFSFGAALGWMVFGYATGNAGLVVTIGSIEVPLGTLIPAVTVSALVLAVGSWPKAAR